MNDEIKNTNPQHQEVPQEQICQEQNKDLPNDKPSLYSELSFSQKSFLFLVPTIVSICMVAVFLFLFDFSKVYQLVWAERELYGSEIMIVPFITIGFMWFFICLFFFVLVRKYKVEVKK